MLLFMILLLVVDCSPSLPTSYIISNEFKAQAYNYRQIFLVMHYTVSDLNRSIRILTGNRVSSHYLVPKGPIDGKRKIYQLVPEEKRAWTQGVSSWGRRSNLNDQGIGVEIVNSGFVYVNKKRQWFSFPQYQIDSVIALSKDIIERYDIQPINVIGHADCAPGRKQDPGPLFPWKQLYENGIGAWPDDVDVACFKSSLKYVNNTDFMLELKRYGYNTNSPRDAVQAFQWHFRPTKSDGIVDIETYAILKALLKKYK